ncbi:1636_t:CDS:1, partial [Funneliformis geosporum]
TIHESDHLPLHITIYKNNIFNTSSNAYCKQHKTTQQSYNFDKITFLHWDLFSDKLDKLIKESKSFQDPNIF